MNITHLIHHPEELNKETLYELRSLLAVHPYYQTARLLMLQNLYLLHDPLFEEELHRSAIYITQREQLFALVEQLTNAGPAKAAETQKSAGQAEPTEEAIQPEEPTRPATNPDHLAAIDYVAYLEQQQAKQPESNRTTQPLIDSFLNKTPEELTIKANEQEPPLMEVPDEEEGEYFTETLAKIYIRQGKFEKALEIIQQLYLNYPKKSRYFADQIRFLEKLIKNNNKINP